MLCSSIIQISRGTEEHKYFLQAYTCLLIKKRSIVYIVLGNLSSNQVSSFTIILSWIKNYLFITNSKEMVTDVIPFLYENFHLVLQKVEIEKSAN
jgi:hypothetical protein